MPSKHITDALELLKKGTDFVDFASCNHASEFINEIEHLDGSINSDCHVLTLALHEMLPDSLIFVIRDEQGDLAFSAIFWAFHGLTLDGAGYSSPGHLLQEWQHKVEGCDGAIESAKALRAEVQPTDQIVSSVLTKFDKILRGFYG